LTKKASRRSWPISPIPTTDTISAFMPIGRDLVAMSEGIKKVEDLQRMDKAFAKRLSPVVNHLVRDRKKRYRTTEA